MPRKWMYRFTVHTCCQRFPMDMLRHDCAWPRTSQDAALLQEAADPSAERSDRAIVLNSVTPPTVDRWSSFGLVVRDDEIYRIPA